MRHPAEVRHSAERRRRLMDNDTFPRLRCAPVRELKLHSPLDIQHARFYVPYHDEQHCGW